MKKNGISLIMVIFFMSIFLILAIGISLSTQRKSEETLIVEKKETNKELGEGIIEILNQDTISGGTQWFEAGSIPTDKTKVVSYVFIEEKSKSYEIKIPYDNLSKIYITILGQDNWNINLTGLTLNADKSEVGRYRSYISSVSLNVNQSYTLNIQNGTGKYIVMVRVFYD